MERAKGSFALSESAHSRRRNGDGNSGFDLLLACATLSDNDDLRSKICLNSCFLIKIKPKFFDFNGYIIHVGPQFSQENVSFYCKTQCLLISDLNDDLIVIIIDIELKTAVVNGVLVCLRLGFAQVLDLWLPVNPPLNKYFNEWPGELLWQIPDLNNIQ